LRPLIREEKDRKTQPIFFKENPMKYKEKVKEILSPVSEYNQVDQEAPLCEAIAMLRSNLKKIEAGERGVFHKTLLVTDASQKIVGKLSVFDLIRGLVPDQAKTPEVSRAFFYRALSERTQAVADEVAHLKERFQWLDHTFFDLVKQETQKKVKEVMAPVHVLLDEEDSISKAIFVMFKENIRQPLVTRKGEIVGVVNIMDIFPLLLEIAGDECFLR
jgi:predicted transcriptional regulator